MSKGKSYFNFMKIKEEEIPELIRLQKDKQVIAHLYDEVFPVVQRYIKKNNGIAEDAKDVFQDALIYFYKQVTSNTFNPKYTVYGYLFRLSINRWFNKLNKDKNVVLKDEILEHFDNDIVYNEGYYPNEEGNNKIKKFISTIGERCVELLTLRIYSDMLFEDIALRLEFSTEASAKMQFKRCRERLVNAIKANPTLVDQLR